MGTQEEVPFDTDEVQGRVNDSLEAVVLRQLSSLFDSSFVRRGVAVVDHHGDIRIALAEQAAVVDVGATENGVELIALGGARRDRVFLVGTGEGEAGLNRAWRDSCRRRRRAGYTSRREPLLLIGPVDD